MRRSVAPLVAALLATGVCACGGASAGTDGKRSTGSVASSKVASASSASEVAKLLKVDADKDNDVEAPYDDRNNNSALALGQPANASDRRAIVSLVERYYRLALAEEGAKACALLYSILAEATPEDYGSFAGPRYMRGNTCPVILTKMFTHFHALLAVELPKLKVRQVRLEDHRGRAILSFGRLPERELLVQREGRHAWKLGALFDGELP
jgi:hypothetical protein